MQHRYSTVLFDVDNSNLFIDCLISTRSSPNLQTSELRQQPAHQGLVAQISDLLGDITGTVGLNCNSVAVRFSAELWEGEQEFTHRELQVIGVTGNNCAAQPACCTGNTIVCCLFIRIEGLYVTLNSFLERWPSHTCMLAGKRERLDHNER